MNSKKEPVYKIGMVLGHGTFGYVFRATEKQTGQPMAWKRAVKATRLMSREVEVLEELKDAPYVVQLVHVFYSLNAENALIQNLIFPLYEADMEQVLNGKAAGLARLDYSNTKRMVFQLTLGLQAAHAKGICHRDLKPENILYRDGLVHISDFGCSKRLGARNSPYSVSRYYRAPELFYGVPDYTCAIDTWSVGVVLWEFVFGRLPFKGRTEGQQLVEIYRFWGLPADAELEQFRDSGCRWSPVFEMLRDVSRSTVFEDSIRSLQVPTGEKALFMSFLRTCFSYDYKRRIFGHALVQHPYFDDIRDKNVRLNIKL